MSVRKFGAGQSVKRVEDVRLVTGQGRYASDACDGATLKAAFVRSPYGRARFSIGDLAAVRAMPGVRAVYTAKDFEGLGGLPCLAPVQNSDGSQTPLKPYPVISGAQVDHVGDIVAMVVAETAAQARDAVEAIACRMGGAARARRHGGGRAARRAAAVRRRARKYRL